MPKRLPNPPYRISNIYFFENESCWDWLGALRGGYGIITTEDKGYKTSVQATRVWFEKLTGQHVSILEQLDHKCRRRICINPKHLEIVDNQTNCQRGKLAILNEAQVREIKLHLKKYPGEKQSYLAKKFNISQPTISAIKLGKLWGNINV